MDQRSQLYQLLNELMNAGRNEYGVLHSATNALYRLLIELSGINPEKKENRDHLHLETGDAIGPAWAAMCTTDLIRTKRFMDGVRKAVDHLHQQVEGKPIHIVYAGTGPFALLLLPLTAIYSCNQIRFTFLEVNETSYTYVRNLWRRLGLDDFIEHAELTDATTWRIPVNTRVDMLVCETMQLALKKEPQVAISLNLFRQLSRDAIVIPERVTLHAALLDVVSRMKEKEGMKDGISSIYQLGTILTLDRNLVEKPAEITISIPPEQRGTHPLLCILTDITVYQDERIDIDESGLTMPLQLIDLSEKTVSAVRFEYIISKNPHVHYELLE